MQRSRRPLLTMLCLAHSMCLVLEEPCETVSHSAQLTAHPMHGG